MKPRISYGWTPSASLHDVLLADLRQTGFAILPANAGKEVNMTETPLIGRCGDTVR
jgi:hypothetical protein